MSYLCHVLLENLRKLSLCLNPSTYTCVARDLYVTASNARVVSVDGKQKGFYSNKDVNDVAIINQGTIFIPDGFGRTFVNLKQLEIISSQLMFVHRKNFVGMTFLEDLRLDDNFVETISSDVLWDLESLQWLSLSGNRIKNLPDDLLAESSRLIWLTADENDIESFDEKLLQKSPKIEMISMRRNKLRNIKLEIDNFKNIFVIDFRDNSCIDATADKNQEVMTFEDIQEDIRVNCSQISKCETTRY